MIEFDKIKLIIWDLDETLWQGTISDEETINVNSEFVDFINFSLDRGIVHSICSKNDYDVAKNMLIKLSIWDLFVFPSIDWTAKGSRVKRLIKEMSLREQNVLFIDDNVQNLNEVKYYCPDIQIVTPEEFESELDEIHSIGHEDKTRSRLKQYKLLEKKVVEKANYESNTEFLLSCNIKVEIKKDCIEHIDRIHELIMRSNQLNYTKFRQDKEELCNLIVNREVESGYVLVSDIYGEYGLVGFYAIKNNKAIHYVFSCRTLGMLVEQYVYMKIGCPEISVVGDVVTVLNKREIPQWINMGKKTVKKERHSLQDVKVLFKGPCDMHQIFAFIAETEKITTDFTYVNEKGISVEGHNHTSQIVTSLTASENEKKDIVNGFEWFDENMLNNRLNDEYDVIILSLLPDGALGIYENKKNGCRISLCESYYDITNKKNWDYYIKGDIFTSNINFSKSALEKFAEEYTYVDNSDGVITVENLDLIYNKIGKICKLVLILGSEKEFDGPVKPSYENRHKTHRVINELVRKWAADKENVDLVQIGDYINSQSDYVDTINHFHKHVYYEMAKSIIGIINEYGAAVGVKSKLFMLLSSIVYRGKIILKKILRRY